MLRAIVAGEYVVNLHLYAQNDPGPVTVTVRLWSLAGSDRMLLERTITLRRQGDEQTAFRFTLSAAGELVDHNLLPMSLVG